MPEESCNQLRTNLMRDGCLDKLVYWPCDGKSILIDGHNRLKICRELGIQFQTKPKAFDGRQDALRWIVANQEGRRNWTEMARSYAVGVAYRETKLPQGRPPTKDGHHVHLKNKGDETAAVIARKYGKNERTVRRDETLAKMLGDSDRDILIIGERDEKPHKRGDPAFPRCPSECRGCGRCWPGLFGAVETVKKLRSLLRRQNIVACFPPAKDVREWLKGRSQVEDGDGLDLIDDLEWISL